MVVQTGKDNGEFRAFTLSEIRAGKADRQIRVFADGIYDLVHFGHIEQFKQLKEAFPGCYVIAGVCSDEDTAKLKGCQPVMNENERARSLALSQYIDEVIIGVPFYPYLDHVNSIKVDLICHDCIPYAMHGGGDCYGEFKKADRFFETHRATDISTSELIARIVKNIAHYEERQSRKRS